MDLLQLLVVLVVFLVVVWCIYLAPFPPPVAALKWVFYVIVAIIFCAWLLSWAGVIGPVTPQSGRTR